MVNYILDIRIHTTQDVYFIYGNIPSSGDETIWRVGYIPPYALFSM